MRHHHLLNKKSESLSIGDVSTVVLISFSIGCQFLQSCPHFRFCSVVVDGAWFVGDSRWYRVSFPITGPSYLSNTLCSVGDQTASENSLLGFIEGGSSDPC